MSLEYPFPEVPAPGTTIEVAPGIHWLSMPLPFQLDLINLWIVRDGDGWAVVDTGIDDGPPIAVPHDPEVDKVQLKRQRHRQPMNAGRDLDGRARRGNF